TPSSQSCYYRSSTDSNLVASPSAVVYSASSIVIYTPEHMPIEPFEVITTVKIPLYNEYKIRRQQAQVDQMFKDQARSLGGDALILVPHGDKKYSYAKVIRIKPMTAKTVNHAESLTSTSAINQASATK
nr:hypothetical protein [Gammaproteobacteria bacterium]